MKLADLKTQALRYVVLGDLSRAFRCYGSIVAQLPSDLDARVKVADLCVSTGSVDAARRIYAAVAFYDIQGGRPLHALVMSQALVELGADRASIAPIHQALAELYGKGSPKLAGRGSRLSPPSLETNVAPPDLGELNVAVAEVARQAAELAASTSNLDGLPESFAAVPLLSELSAESFARVVATVKVHRLSHGKRVIEEGAVGHSFFLVAAGQVRVTKARAGQDDLELARLGEGAVFGELALVAAEPRSASVEVVGEADLLELGAESLRAAAGELAQLSEALSRFTRERLLKNVMATSPLFLRFSPEERVDLVRRFEGRELGTDEVLAEAGDEASGLYILVLGEIVAQGGKAHAFVAGDVFGEEPLLSGAPVAVTLVATRPSTVLHLPKDAWKRLLLVLPDLRAFFEELSVKRAAKPAVSPAAVAESDQNDGDDGSAFDVSDELLL